MLDAGSLRHRITIQKQVQSQDTTSGAINVSWVDIAIVWAKVSPFSAREFVAAESEVSKVMGRVTIRYRDDVTAKHRFYHQAKDRYYNIEGVLDDNDSGLEYITFPVSEGVRYTEGMLPIPENLEVPIINGSATPGETLTVLDGTWSNDPTSYSYQWYVDNVAQVSGITNEFVVPNSLGAIVKAGVIARNATGASPETLSPTRTIA